MKNKRVRRERAEVTEAPTPNPEHDLLVFPRENILKPWEYYRVPVNKGGTEEKPNRAGEFELPPEKWDLADHGSRKVVSIARPQDGAKLDAREVQSTRGPAIATLPVKPEPSSAFFGTCFLVNADRFDIPNLWTVEEWSDGPGGANFESPQHPDELEVLLAGPQGKVFRLKLRELHKWERGQEVQLEGGRGEVESVDLGLESEIWQQLRNGCVAGQASYEGCGHEAHRHEAHKKGTGRRSIPLVNITALQPGLASKKASGS